LACTYPEDADRAAKALLRLCSVCPDGLLEWKPEIDSEQALLRCLHGSTAVRATELVDLWSESHQLRQRTAYPSLAPAGRKNQHVSVRSFRAAPVFGVDILVRPPTEFAEDRVDGLDRHTLVLGAECMALVIHGDFDGSRLADGGIFFTRLVVGDALSVPRITAEIPAAAGRCEMAMLEPLVRGDLVGAIDASLPYLDRFADSVGRALVS